MLIQRVEDVLMVWYTGWKFTFLFNGVIYSVDDHVNMKRKMSNACKQDMEIRDPYRNLAET